VKHILKRIDLIAALIVIGLALTDLYPLVAHWIPLEHWTWAVKFASPVLGIWIGAQVCRSVVNLGLDDDSLSVYRNRYLAHLYQAHGNPIMEASVKATWRTFVKAMRAWERKTWWERHVKVDWTRAVCTAYRKAGGIILFCGFVLLLPNAINQADPPTSVLGLIIAVWIIYTFWDFLAKLTQDIATEVGEQALAHHPIIPVDIPIMLLEEIPPAPLHVQLKRELAELRALSRHEKIRLAAVMVILALFAVPLGGSLLHLAEIAVTRPPLDQLLVATVPFWGCIAFIIVVLAAITPKKPKPALEPIHVVEEAQ
jgi:hypothetical protein